MLVIGEKIKTLCFRFDEDFFKLLVIFHDLGKISKEWQEKLKKGENLPKHSGLSSFILFLIYKSPDLLDKYFFSYTKFFH
jgi:CRISPR/Cas system-associated endonuclease Cas3-HD